MLNYILKNPELKQKDKVLVIKIEYYDKWLEVKYLLNIFTVSPSGKNKWSSVVVLKMVQSMPDPLTLGGGAVCAGPGWASQLAP